MMDSGLRPPVVPREPTELLPETQSNSDAHGEVSRAVHQWITSCTRGCAEEALVRLPLS